MRSNRRAVVAAVLSVLLGLGVFAAFTLTGNTARADTANVCSQISGAPTCTASATITNLQSAQLTILANPDVGAAASPSLSATPTLTANPTDSADLTYSYTATWSSQCTFQGDVENGGSQTAFGTNLAAGTSKPFNIALPFANNDSCTITAKVAITGTAGTFPIQLLVQVVFVPETAASASPSASSSSATVKHYNQVSGFDGKCLDDSGNSSANRAKIVIWNCSSTDAAQGWSYSGSSLHHNGKCLNAKGTNPKKGAPVMLWSCNGQANEIFIHKGNGEYQLKAGGYKMCLDDPGFSTKNGHQLDVWSCNNGPNQHWSLP